jgi:hypothetical protein
MMPNEALQVAPAKGLMLVRYHDLDRRPAFKITM